MGKKAKSPAEKERAAAERAFEKRTAYYRKAGYYVHDESEEDGRGSGLLHTSGDQHCRDQGTHQQYYGDTDDRNDPDTPLLTLGERQHSASREHQR